MDGRGAVQVGTRTDSAARGTAHSNRTTPRHMQTERNVRGGEKRHIRTEREKKETEHLCLSLFSLHLLLYLFMSLLLFSLQFSVLISSPLAVSSRPVLFPLPQPNQPPVRSRRATLPLTLVGPAFCECRRRCVTKKKRERVIG